MQKIASHIVPLITKPIRLQEYAVGIFTTLPTKSGLKKAIKKKRIYVNNSLASTGLFITGGEVITLYENPNATVYKPFNFSLTVLFEDTYLAAIYKPAGIVVSGNTFASIDNALPTNLQASTAEDAVRPRPVHRLDYPTSGVLLIGKTSSSIIALNKLFAEKTIHKTYYAITIGKMPKQGTISSTIAGKDAVTEYTVITSVSSNRFDCLNLVKLEPKTGRKHQLRIHLAHIGNQILGDKEHGDTDLILNGKGLYLHAASLKFIHPFTQQPVHITTELPKKFTNIFPKHKIV